MEKLKIEVEVSKEMYELGIGLGQVVLKMKEALEDGFQVTDDIPVIIQTAIKDLVPAMKGIEQIDDEAKEDLGSFLDAVWLSLKPVVFGLLKK